MATNTAGVVARELPFQAVHYMRMDVAYNTTGISTGVAMPAYLPAGALILSTNVYVTTAFNAVTTNVLTVGTVSSAYNNMVAAGEVDETATGGTSVLTGMDLTFASDTQVFIKYTQTGTAATTGAATVVVAYVVNNDS